MGGFSTKATALIDLTQAAVSSKDGMMNTGRMAGEMNKISVERGAFGSSLSGTFSQDGIKVTKPKFGIEEATKILRSEMLQSQMLQSEREQRYLLKADSRNARRKSRLLRSGNSAGEVYDPASRSSLYSKLESEMPSQTQSEQYKKYALNPEMENLSLGTSAQKPGSKGYRFASARRALLEYNRSQENQSRAGQIKSILLDQSGLSRAAIKAATGLYPEQVRLQTPSGLESLLRRKNILIGQKNTEAYGDKEGRLITDIDLSKANLTAEQIEEITKGVKDAKQSKRFIADPSGNIVEQITDTKLSKLKYPSARESKSPYYLGDFKIINGTLKGLEGFSKDTTDSNVKFGLSDKLSLGGLSGYVSKKDIDLQAAELLKLEESLLVERRMSPEAKDSMVKEFLEKLGPYGSKVKEASNKLLEKQNFEVTQSEIKGKFEKMFDPNTGKVTLNNTLLDPTGSAVFDSVAAEIRKAIVEGKLTPEQGAKLQSKIYSDTFGVSPNEYGSVLKRKGVNGSSLADYLATEAEPNLNDKLKAKGVAADLDLLNKRMNRTVGYEFDPATGKATPSSQRSPNWISFSDFVLQRTKEINENPDLTKEEKKITIEKLRMKRAQDEATAKRDFAKNRGFEYNPLTGEAMPEGSFAEAAKARRNEKASIAAAQEKGFGKVGHLGMGVAGVAFGALGAYEQFKEGNKVEGSLTALGAAASLPEGLISKIPRLQSLVEKIGGQETLGRVAGGAFGIAGGLSSISQAGKEFTEGKTGQAAYSTLQGLVSGGAGATSLIGQTLMSQRLFGVGAGLGFARELYNAKDNNFQLISGNTTKGRFLSALTGQSFEKQSYIDPETGETKEVPLYEQLLAAGGDVAGSAFTAGMGGIGAGVTVARLGYRLGNFLEQSYDDSMGFTQRASKYGSRRIQNADEFGVERSNSIGIVKKTEDDLTDEEKAYKAYLEAEKKKYTYRSESGFLSGFNPSNYLFNTNNYSGGFIPNFAAPKKYSKKFLLEAKRKSISAETLYQQLYGPIEDPNKENALKFTRNDILLAAKRGVPAETIAKERRGETEDPNKQNKFGFSQIDAQIASLRGVPAETIAKERESALNKKIGLPSSDSDGVSFGGNSYYTTEQIKAANNAKVSVETFVERNSAPKNVLIGEKSFSPDQIKQAADSGVSVETLVGRKNSSNEPTLIGGKSFSSDQIRQAANTGVSVESLSAKSEADLDAKIKGIKTGLDSDSLQYASPEERAALKEKYDKLKGGLTGSASEEIDLPSKANGLIPNFAVSKEMAAIKNSPAYAGYRNATPTRSSVYDGITINTAEIEPEAEDVYRRMFGPIGYLMKPKNPNETHAILNPAQQSALGYAGGFVPNFSNEQFASMMSEAMKNGMASFMADGFMPAASNSNVVNINDNRNVQSSMESNPGVLDAVMDVLLKMHPKEMAAIGPKITKVR